MIEFDLDSKFTTDPKKFVTAFVEKCSKREHESDPGAAPTDDTWPSPFSDFTHVDPIESAEREGTHEPITFKGDKLEDIRGRLTEAIDNEQDDKKREELSDLKTYLAELRKVVGPNSDGMRRLGSVFEWVLWKATVLLNDVDQKLATGSSDADRIAYMAARENYISFLKELDDREPETKLRKMDHTNKDAPELAVVPGKRGYGRPVKWAYIDPVIAQGRITQARVIAQWNPHSSSSGIPVRH